MQHSLSRKLAYFAAILAFVVIVLGAYTRLTDAGLGCPDWPGCYGHMTVTNQELNASQSTKAWTEMIHRYAAGSLGLIIISLLGISIKRRKQQHPVVIPIILACLLIFQALLGMWTVTLKLHPLVVMGHLIGGLSILSLLWTLRLQLQNKGYQQNSNISWGWALGALLILITQIALGAWVSSNYAGLSCIGFPFCNGQLLPNMNLHDAFTIAPLGSNFQGGILSNSARVTIQMVHRIGALITVCYFLLLSIYLLIKGNKQLKVLSLIILSLCTLQAILGIINVTALLPLFIAVAHNAVAALLLVTIVTLNYRLITAKSF